MFTAASFTAAATKYVSELLYCLEHEAFHPQVLWNGMTRQSRGQTSKGP